MTTPIDASTAWWGQLLEGLRWPAPQTAPDRRFAGDAWQGDPRFAALAHGYLAQAQMLEQALLASPMDERTRAQWRFMLRQVIDAASPADCLATNPEVMQQALDSGGMSLVAGLQLFMRDLAKGRLSMTDEAAFEVGRNVAMSPGSVVFENELMQLIQFAPGTPQVR